MDILSELQVVEKIVLRENLISEKGIRSFMRPVNVKRSSLQSVVEMDLRENRIKTLDCKWFDGLIKLKTLSMDPIKQLFSSHSIGKCQKPIEHTINCSQTKPIPESKASEMAIEVFCRLMQVEKTAKTNSKSNKSDDFIILCSVHKCSDHSKARKRKTIISKPAAKKGRFKM